MKQNPKSFQTITEAEMQTKRKSSKYQKHIQSITAEEMVIERDEITCPYCYSLTHFVYGIEGKCEVCRQVINDGDLLYENQ